MNGETDIVEELERVNVLFYVNRGEVFQKGEAVGYDPANDKVVKLGTPGSMRLGTVQIYIPPEKAETHVHRVSDAIQPSHPLSSPSPFTFNLSQHQGLFQ